MASLQTEHIGIVHTSFGREVDLHTAFKLGTASGGRSRAA